MCERAIKTLIDLADKHNLEIDVIDIIKDERLLQEYFLKIPVVQLDGQDVLEAKDLATQLDCERNLVNLVASLH